MIVDSPSNTCLGELCPNFNNKFIKNLNELGEQGAESMGWNIVDTCLDIAVCVLNDEVVFQEDQNA